MSPAGDYGMLVCTALSLFASQLLLPHASVAISEVMDQLTTDLPNCEQTEPSLFQTEYLRCSVLATLGRLTQQSIKKGRLTHALYHFSENKRLKSS